MALAASALDQLVHVGHGCLIVVSRRCGGRGPRHETPPFVLLVSGIRCSCVTVLHHSAFTTVLSPQGQRRGLAEARHTWYCAARALSSNAHRGHLFPCRCRAPAGGPGLAPPRGAVGRARSASRSGLPDGSRGISGTSTMAPGAA